MVTKDYQQELDFALTCARELGKLIGTIRDERCEVGEKPDRSLVTTADLEANATFIERVKAVYPGDRVLGEEASLMVADTSRTWVIDPLDGTTEFLWRIPEWMIAIALVVDGHPVVGVAFNPSTDEMYWATVGGGAYRDGKPIRVSSRDWYSKEGVIIGTGDNRDPADLSGTMLQGTLDGDAQFTDRGGRPYVFAGVKTAEGAEGYIDGFVYPFDGAHDMAAISVVITEAGGKVTGATGDWQPLDRPIKGAVGSNGIIHDRLVEASLTIQR